MQKKVIGTQLTNFRTYEMYKRQIITLATNVFVFKNLPTFVDVSYINLRLLREGSIAWFVDDVMGLLALPYRNINGLDVYGRPNKIEVYSDTGYTKVLNRNEFVIMYDNSGHYPLFLDLCKYAERLALCERTSDINIDQQKTPRFWKTSKDNELSVKDIVNNVDAFSNAVITYKNIDLSDTTVVLAPAPFVADKIDLHKEKIWNELLRLIGIANQNFQKKERNIKDEVLMSQGGTIASRLSRYEPRKRAIDEINEKFNANLEIGYYDGLPNSEEKTFRELEESEEIDEMKEGEDL